MESNKLSTPPTSTSSQPIQDKSVDAKSQRRLIISIGAIGIVLLAAIIVSIYFLATTSPANTSRIRDIFIIFMALESLVIGIALIILVLQLATLINLLQNEIKPILDSTKETVNTLRGTTAFLSNNLVEPVIKLNQYMAVLKRLIDLVRIPH